MFSHDILVRNVIVLKPISSNAGSIKLAGSSMVMLLSILKLFKNVISTLLLQVNKIMCGVESVTKFITKQNMIFWLSIGVLCAMKQLS